MFELIGSVLTAVLSGGATGLFGVVIQRWFDYKNRKQDLELVAINNAHALALADRKVQEVAAEWQGRKEVAEVDLAATTVAANAKVQEAEAAAAAAMLAAAHASDKGTFLTPGVLRSRSRFVLWSMAAVDALRGAVRPGLTIYLVYITQCVYDDMRAILARYGQQLPVAVAQELTTQVVTTVLYLSTVSIVFWFGTRPPAKPSR